jgi:uncharacterized protein with von Willebrand factor type A (vWA) domain
LRAEKLFAGLINHAKISLAYRLLNRREVKKVLASLPQADENRRCERLTHAILAYCIDHPDAKDTLEGIFDWWFREARWRIDEVQTALEDLTAQGWLTRRSMRPAEMIYGLNKEKIAEIEAFLKRAVTAAK